MSTRNNIKEIRFLQCYYVKKEKMAYFTVIDRIEEVLQFWYQCHDFDEYANLQRMIDQKEWWIIHYNEYRYITQFNPVIMINQKKKSYSNFKKSFCIFI